MKFCLERVNAGLRNSAFLFFIFFFFLFGVSGCDPVETKGNNSHTNIEPQPVQYSRQLLRRGIYQPWVLQPEKIQFIEQAALLRDLFEGLVIYDPHGNPQAGVAESWQTQDQKNWIFKLRANASWSNGEKVTAHDFVRSWQQLALSDSPFKDYLLFMNIQHAQSVLAKALPVEQLGVQALDEQTLRIQLDKPTPFLVAMLAHVALLPNNSNQQVLVTNGAYQLKQVQDKGLLLEKNPYYWDVSKVAFTQVEYVNIKENDELSLIDWVVQPNQLNANHQLPRLCSYFYAFNLTDPVLKQASVRRALASMLSAQHLLPQDSVWTMNNHLLPKSMQTEELSNWEQTPIEQLLQQAGISETKPLNIKISYDAEGEHAQIAQNMIRVWSQSDLIRIQSEPLNAEQMQQKRAQGDFQLIRSGWCADYNEPTAFFSLFYSHSPDNYMKVNDSQVDQLLEQSVHAQNEIERQALYQKINQYIEQQQFILPLFQYRQGLYIQPSLAGYDENNPTEVFYSKDFYRRVGQ